MLPIGGSEVTSSNYTIHATVALSAIQSIRNRSMHAFIGFGSLLRAMGNKRSGEETDNIDACRDLSGRRLRHVEGEKKYACMQESYRGIFVSFVCLIVLFEGFCCFLIVSVAVLASQIA